VKTSSIRFRLSLMVLALTLVVVGVLSVAAYIEFEESLLGNVDATLSAMAEGMRATLDGMESSENQEAELRAIAGYHKSGEQARYRIWADESKDSMFASGSPDDPFEARILDPLVKERPEVGESSLFNVSDKMKGRNSTFRVIWFRFASGQQVMNVLVARSCGYVYHELAEFLQLLLIVGGSATLLTGLLVPIIISHGLRAIADVGAKLGQITHSNLTNDSGIMPDVPIELKPFQSALQEMLSRLHKAMQQQEQLTADVAHELRTPLAIIKSTLQTLRMRDRPAIEYEQGIDDTLKDVDRVEHLISQLLSLTRLDAADAVHNPTEIRLDALLRSLTDVFHDRASQQGGRVVFANSTPILVRGDETELWQLFSNLLDNAIRHGPRGGFVHVALQEGPDSWATVCVHDNGGAIPPESLAHLFDRFYRVDSSRSQTSGGSGLGLAIARGIVQRHHGDIAITSDPKAGTSAVVHLPRP
jgi:two-component system heavy metal sensor histidine kinase CusS